MKTLVGCGNHRSWSLYDGVATDSGGTESVLQSRQNLSRQNPRFVLTSPALNPDVTDPPKFTTATFTTNNDNIMWPDLMPMWDGNKEATFR